MIAEEFESLIARDAVLRPARQRGNMSQRALKQRLVGELVADALFEGRSILRLAAHLTTVNRRLQRTENGQRQISQARSPS
jgi:hypothetical protein